MISHANLIGRGGFRGYTNHTQFGGNRIPVPIQNLIMRDYANRRNLLFKLSVNEFNFANCYVQLMNMLKQLYSLDGVLMCSLFMLPQKKDIRLSIYRAFIDQETELHFIMESVILKEPPDINYIEDLFQMTETLSACPTSIPENLLSKLEAARFTG